jgi:outer membrane receptor protein involved in Fe transport
MTARPSSLFLRGAWLPPLLVTFSLVQAAVEPGLLEEVVVYATRMATSRSDLPFAAGVVAGEQVQRGRQQLGLDEALAGQPGMFFQNRYNFAQDLRIAIRGFGARAISVSAAFASSPTTSRRRCRTAKAASTPSTSDPSKRWR